ncbi:MAG: CRISPR-associated endonuclease Cas1 [Thermoprotei archaeon]|nr:MAG: CRISPR-associated endonuclease Cas1 [Thermoprotei archaeon]
MRYIVISGYGKKIRTRKNMLNIVNMDGEKINIAFGDIDSLIIASNGISITSNVIRKLIRHGVDIVFLDGSGRPIGRIYPPFINRTVATRRCQYQAYFDERRWIIIETFIESKFRNQANLLKYYSKSRDMDDLREIGEKILEYISRIRGVKDRDKIIRIEAEAARIYWSGVSMLLPEDIEFNGRSPESFDLMNICINYCNSLVYSECWKALVLAGLDPYAGYLHSDRSGKESLIYDFSEMFKTVSVDRLLIKIFSSGERFDVEMGLLTNNSRKKLIKYFYEWMERRVRPTSGTPCTLRQCFRRWALKLASYLRNDLKTFRGFIES